MDSICDLWISTLPAYALDWTQNCKLILKKFLLWHRFSNLKKSSSDIGVEPILGVTLSFIVIIPQETLLIPEMALASL